MVSVLVSEPHIHVLEQKGGSGFFFREARAVKVSEKSVCFMASHDEKGNTTKKTCHSYCGGIKKNS